MAGKGASEMYLSAGALKRCVHILLIAAIKPGDSLMYLILGLAIKEHQRWEGHFSELLEFHCPPGLQASYLKLGRGAMLDLSSVWSPCTLEDDAASFVRSPTFFFCCCFLI